MLVKPTVKASWRQDLQYLHPQVSRVISCFGLIDSRQMGHSMARSLELPEVGRGFLGFWRERTGWSVECFRLRVVVVGGLDGAIAVGASGRMMLV